MNLSLLWLPLLCLGADAGVPQVAPTAEPPLDAIVRGLLRKRMEGHGRDQSRLVMAVTLLDRPVVKAIADDLAAEPKLVRPRVGARDELNSALPERFFVLQDALQQRARALSEAAQKKDDLGVARSFGQLVETCVTCHSTFRGRE